MNSVRTLAPTCARLLMLLLASMHVASGRAVGPPPPTWLVSKAYDTPSQHTNQESGYFSIIDGENGRLYIGAAKYGMETILKSLQK
jgi:hypothetical protein